MFACFWMVVGGLITAVGSHLYHNDKIKQVIQEERAKAEKAVSQARTAIKERL